MPKKKTSASQCSIDLRLVDQETGRLLALTHEFSQPNHYHACIHGLNMYEPPTITFEIRQIYEPCVIAICKNLPIFGFRRSNLHGNLSKVDFPLGKYAKSSSANPGDCSLNQFKLVSPHQPPGFHFFSVSPSQLGLPVTLWTGTPDRHKVVRLRNGKLTAKPLGLMKQLILCLSMGYTPKWPSSIICREVLCVRMR